MTAEITSANVVGYQQVQLPANGQYALLTPTFTDVSGAVFDLTDIKVVKPGAATFTSLKKVKIQKIKTDGQLGDEYAYTTLSGGKWVNNTKNHDASKGECVFSDGEAMFLYNGDTSGSAVCFQFSGEVALTPASSVVAPNQYGLIGNFTPVPVDLLDCYPIVNGARITGTSLKKFKIQKLNSNGILSKEFAWTTLNGGKWVNNTDNHDAIRGECTFQAGEAMFVSNTDTSKTIGVMYPSPISEK